jgi:NADPH-dependent 2,4-dienoyl-CoA reductase/sulfur reductase-like enzyme
MTSRVGPSLRGLLSVRPGRAANDNKKLTSDAIVAFDLTNLRILLVKLKDSLITVMAPSKLQKDDAVVIVGAGIFGLSTALHLASRGYTNVTVFDRQNYDETLYSYQKGCDAASAGEQNLSANFT